MLTAANNRRDRQIARQAEQTGRAILQACRGLVAAHEIVIADREDIPAGKPLVSLVLYRLGFELHAYRASAIASDLAADLAAESKRLDGRDRAVVMRLAGIIKRI